MAITYDKALQCIEDHISPLARTQECPMVHSVGRISATALYARYALPTTPIALKDGYAFAFENTHAWHSVSTGDPLPLGCDTLAPVEMCPFTHQDFIPPHLTQGLHVKRQGEDVCVGDRLLDKGERIGAYALSLVCAQGIEHIEVFERPRIGIISIGNTLQPLGKTQDPAKIYNSNAMTLSARLQEKGAYTHAIQTVVEEKRAILGALEEMAPCVDWIITTGGLSAHDVMEQMLRHHVIVPLFHEVAIWPARPSALSLWGKTPMLHLPGLPLACLLGFELLGIPILNRLNHQHARTALSYQQQATQAFACHAQGVRAIPGYSDGRSFTPATHYEAGRLNTLRSCNGFARMDHTERIEEGEWVDFIPF